MFALSNALSPDVENSREVRPPAESRIAASSPKWAVPTADASARFCVPVRTVTVLVLSLIGSVVMMLITPLAALKPYRAELGPFTTSIWRISSNWTGIVFQAT